MSTQSNLFATARIASQWLDEANGCSEHELTLRLLKIAEEVGEVAEANLIADAGKELADVALSAATALVSLRIDWSPSQVRISTTQPGADYPVGLLIVTMRVTAAAGKVAGAWIGYTEQNPRKGVTHTLEQVGDALIDLINTALDAIAGLGLDPAEVIGACTAKVMARLGVPA